LSVVSLVHAEQSLEGVVARNDKASDIGKELTADVEEDKSEVDTDQAEKSVDFRNLGLLLQIVQGGILGKLLINLGNVALGLILERGHCECSTEDGTAMEKYWM